MRVLHITIYRTLEWNTHIELPDEEDEEADSRAIASLAASTVSANFDQINEEYAELESGARIHII